VPPAPIDCILTLELDKKPIRCKRSLFKMEVEMLRMKIEDLFCLYDLTGYRSKITILHNLRLTILKNTIL
jgi:hypothetical protein